MSQASYTVEEILSRLDEHGRELTFPMLDNGYIYPGDVRLSAYADETRWAILIEQLGFHYRWGLPDGIVTTLYVFANCFVDSSDRAMVGGFTYEATPDEETEGWLSVPSSLTEVMIRERRVTIPRDPIHYASKGIMLQQSPTLQAQEVMRVLLPEHREAMLATEEERRRLIPHDLPLFARLDEWHHPDLAGEELVSECSTFQNLARAIVALEPNMFRLTEKPNTHWSNWPMGGSL